MIRPGMVGVGVVLALVLVSHAQNDDSAKKLKSADAKKALVEYDKALTQARDTFDKDVEAARKKLLTYLGAAQEKAAKANELDEAVLIRDISKGYEEGTQPAPKDGKLQVVSAFYGQNVSWLDVTEKVRQSTNGKAKWSATVSTKDWGEPAPGWSGTRTLMIRYSVGGKVLFKAVYEGNEIALP